MSLRRSSRLPSAPALSTAAAAPASARSPRKRPSNSQPTLTSSLPAIKRTKSAPAKPTRSTTSTTAPTPSRPILPEKTTVLLHPPLTFDFAEARRHLERTDERWGPLMDRLRCKPYQDGEGEAFNPFMSLVTSLIGQQISWMAARSVQHKFTKLFFPDLPDLISAKDSKTPTADGSLPPKADRTLFPTPHQVLALPDALNAMRGAGLSQRKAEYVHEIATRFADGRLDAESMWKMNDEELHDALIDVRGIGPWTVAMFLQFVARRPDVCATGDLGLQKGLLIWYTTPANQPPPVKAEKLPLADAAKKEPAAVAPPATATEPKLVPATPDGVPSLASLYPTPASPTSTTTAALSQTLAPAKAQPPKLPEIPEGCALTHATLKNRLAGNKVKGGMYLTPVEMEQLTEQWRPFRSVGLYYMWSLVDG